MIVRETWPVQGLMTDIMEER